jgi:hypothetical protein
MRKPVMKVRQKDAPIQAPEFRRVDRSFRKPCGKIILVRLDPNSDAIPV